VVVWRMKDGRPSPQQMVESTGGIATPVPKAPSCQGVGALPPFTAAPPSPEGDAARLDWWVGEGRWRPPTQRSLRSPMSATDLVVHVGAEWRAHGFMGPGCSLQEMVGREPGVHGWTPPEWLLQPGRNPMGAPALWPNRLRVPTRLSWLLR
jgi:hypothetical protein